MTPEERRGTTQTLDQRARDLARPVAEEVRAGTDYLVAVVGGQKVAVPVSAVREVLAPGPLTRLPRTPPELAGVRGVRGEVLCLVDTAALLVLRAERSSEQQHVVTLLDDAPLGLLVDEVDGLATFDQTELSRPPVAGRRSDSLVTSVTRAGTLLLDPSAVLADPRLDDSTTTPTPDEGRA